MKRGDVMEGLLAVHARPRYLEIGVHAGVTFHRVVAARKVAVDPEFAFDLPQQRLTPEVEYHAVPSDVYFGQIIGTDERFDVIFLDGLHTSEQTLRDLLSAIEHLAEGGVIVIDDVLPNSYAASLPDGADVNFLKSQLPIEADNPGWMGDVFRVALFVAAFMQAFTFALVEGPPGQLVMWRQRRGAVQHPDQTLEWTGRADILALLRRKSELNLTPYADIVESYRRSRTAA